MIENNGKTMDELEPRARREPTWDGSLFGPDVCRCGDHIDPHRHTGPDRWAVSIFEGGDDDDAAKPS